MSGTGAAMESPRTLSDRKAAILRAVVEGYISTNQPVGSSHVVADASLAVSPATVRAEMVALEEAGFLHQPHTSAGRIPTEKGYRYFVDTLMPPYQLAQAESTQVRSFFDTVHGELERLLRETSAFVAELTDYTSLVVGPDPHRDTTIRAVNLVRLTEDTLLVVVVFATGAIERRQIACDHDLTAAQVGRASALVSAAVAVRHPGTALSARLAVSSSGDPVVDALVDTVVDALVTPEPGDVPVYLGGTSTVATIFDAVGKVREVLEVLEQQYLVVTLVRDVLDRGLNVAIGSETGVQPLSECSLVVAPVEVDGQAVGSVGVLGPTRMNYPQTLAAVALVSQQLGQRLHEG
jgi:heat-inducible transcriptional repressor